MYQTGSEMIDNFRMIVESCDEFKRILKSIDTIEFEENGFMFLSAFPTD